MIIEISNADNRLIIDSALGGRATQWFHKELQILGPKGDHPLVGGWYLMAPWAGRIRDNQVTYQKRKYPQKVNMALLHLMKVKYKIKQVIPLRLFTKQIVIGQ